MPRGQETRPLVVETVRALAIAWRNCIAYRPGHPAFLRALAQAHERLSELIVAEGDLSIGVGRNSLILEKTKVHLPQAEWLARALHERDIALLRIDRGVELGELETLFQVLARDPRQGDDETLREQLEAANTRHIRLQSIDYSLIRVTDEVGLPDAESPVDAESLVDRILDTLMERDALAAAAGSLWDRLLRDQMTAEPSSPAGSEERGAPSVTELAALIGESLRRIAVTGGTGQGSGAAAGRGADGPAGEPVEGERAPVGGDGGATALATEVGGRLAAVVEAHLSDSQSPARSLAARQVAELALGLPAEIRDAVIYAALRAVGRLDGDAEVLHAFSSPFAPGAIVKALQRVQSEGTTLSRHALLLVQSLAGASPDESRETPESQEEEALRAELVALFRDDDIDRFNPEDHQALLEHVAVELPKLDPVTPGADPGDRIQSLGDEALAWRLGEVLLEMLSRYDTGEGVGTILGRLVNVFRSMLNSGRLEEATEIVQTLRALTEDPQRPPDLQSALRESLDHMAGVDALAELLASLGPLSEQASAVAVRLLNCLGPLAVENLLLVLIDEPHRSRRRRIFTILVSLGPTVVPTATRLLEDPRWYVVRNMITLLRAVGDTLSLADIRRCADHPDIRVRIEALKSLLLLDPRVGRELLERAMSDPDPKVAEAAATMAGQHRLHEGVESLVRVLGGWDLQGRRRAVRVAALRALAELGRPEVLPRLARFFRGWLTLVAAEERRVAFESLESYPEAAREPWVRKGLRARDGQVRAICQRLSRVG